MDYNNLSQSDQTVMAQCQGIRIVFDKITGLKKEVKILIKGKDGIERECNTIFEMTGEKDESCPFCGSTSFIYLGED